MGGTDFETGTDSAVANVLRYRGAREMGSVLCLSALHCNISLEVLCRKLLGELVPRG
jgi:hypothetical protein